MNTLYKHGEKAGHLLAHELLAHDLFRYSHNSTISQIENTSGQIITDPSGMGHIQFPLLPTP